MPAVRLRLAVLCALPVLLAACAALDGSTYDAPEYQDPGRTGGPGPVGFGERVSLSRTDERVRTVQLYRTGDETSLPVVGLDGGTLTLGFDVIDSGTGRPLSVYFYHADRAWRRDLAPSEYLRAFLNDDIRTYLSSSISEVPYVHYAYEFPNANIGFLVSGNYVVRVTEQGQEGAVLLERPFFVTEDAAEAQLGFQSGFVGGAPVVQPVVQLRPGPALDTAQPFDYGVCFARNGRFDRPRCTEDPSLLDLSLFQFYLAREDAFAAERPFYEVDLGPLQIGPEVTSIDRSTSPPTVLLDLDFARFGGLTSDAALTGQPVVQTVYRGGGQPETQGQYASVRFRYVPEEERPAAGPVLLSGAFNDWQLDPALALDWNPETARYEGTLLLKQGLYLYQYVIDDPSAEPHTLTNQPSLYTALVYLRDNTRLTDRLVAVRSAIGQ